MHKVLILCIHKDPVQGKGEIRLPEDLFNYEYPVQRRPIVWRDYVFSIPLHRY